MDTVFDQPGSTAINKARMEHLASLGLDLKGRTVLEVGSGVGELTYHFEDLGCDILSTDARSINVEEHRRRHPERRVEVADLTLPGSHDRFGKFDVVFCYGTFYHLPDPALAIKDIARVCTETLLLETCVSPPDDTAINLVTEPTSALDQSFQGGGCRPGRPWVFKELKKYFPHVYVTLTQPDHPQFPLEWPVDTTSQNSRAVFVASRTRLDNQKLVPYIPVRQYVQKNLPVYPRIRDCCTSYEHFLPVTTQEILRDFDLLSGHPWAEHAASSVTNYYGCLHALAKSDRPRRILEIGTAFGMSGASLISACSPLELFISVDLGFFHKEYNFPESNIQFSEKKIHDWCRKNGLAPDKARYFQANSQPNGKSDNDNKIEGVPHWTEVPELVSLLSNENFDVLFVDGKHTEDGLYNDMVSFWQYLKPEGLLLCDDLHDPAIYKGMFPWAGETLECFHRFVSEYADEIDDWHIWEFPHVLPPTYAGLRPFGIIRKKESTNKPLQDHEHLDRVFPGWIQAIAASENRLYYRDQTDASLAALVKTVERYRPTRVVELGTLSGLSLRTWLSADPQLLVTAIDLSFDSLLNSQQLIPLDLSRVTMVQQNILTIDFSTLWSKDDRVIFYVDAHDDNGIPIMDHVLRTALPTLPIGSIVMVDDVWYSPVELNGTNIQGFFESVMLNEIDPLQCFEGYYAPYWKGGSFFGFLEVIPLLEWANRNRIELEFQPGVKSIAFQWGGVC